MVLDRQTDRQMDRQTDRQTERKSDIQCWVWKEQSNITHNGKRRPITKKKILDVAIVNSGGGKYELKIHHKKCKHKCQNETRFVH